MLQILIPQSELFDEKKQEFISIKETKICLEHSLVSVSKWEAKWKKPFIPRTKMDKKTDEEIIDYIRCMTITQNVNPMIYSCLSNENITEIMNYIDDPMTATTIVKNSSKAGQKEVLTSEVIYYYMFSCGIPLECQKWHFNRLIMLINIFGEKNNPKKKKMSRQEIMERNRELNEQRKAKLGTTG